MCPRIVLFCLKLEVWSSLFVYIEGIFVSGEMRRVDGSVFVHSLLESTSNRSELFSRGAFATNSMNKQNIHIEFVLAQLPAHHDTRKICTIAPISWDRHFRHWIFLLETLHAICKDTSRDDMWYVGNGKIFRVFGIWYTCVKAIWKSSQLEALERTQSELEQMRGIHEEDSCAL